jgi:DNA-binding transcriptional ArsR family regulator
MMGVSGEAMSKQEDEIYSTMFSSLKHPARRKILRMLEDRQMTFSEMLDTLQVTSSNLTYHLESLGELLIKMDNGKYKLSTFGEATVTTMKRVEEAPTKKSKGLSLLSIQWKSVFAVLSIIIILLASLSAIQYVSYGKLMQDQADIQNSINEMQTSLNQSAIQNQQLQSNISQLAAANQQLLSWGTGTDKAIGFIRNVLRINITAYTASLLSDTVAYRSDLGDVLEEKLKYSLTSQSGNDSEIDITLRFRNNHFSQYQLFVDVGSPIYLDPPPIDSLAYVRDFLARYQAYTGEPYLGDMRTLMGLVNETNANSTTLNHTKLAKYGTIASGYDILMYTEKGVDFTAKSLWFEFQDHLLSEFTDGWFLFTIGSTQVSISKPQAILIAEDAASSFSWNSEGTLVNNFTLVLSGVSVTSSPHPREPSSTALIPLYFIVFPLDKTYPGQINSISVEVWGDNGQVGTIKPLTG